MDDFKSINSLMKHLRDNGITISGSRDKKNLINIGYYHGYKGYRFSNVSTNRISYKDFDELMYVIEFDERIKSILYSPLMKIETTLKNISLDSIMTLSKGSSFLQIYNVAMDNKNMALKLRVRNGIHRALSEAYNSNNKIVQHFYDRQQEVPIWGIFEILTLGSFGEFIKCLKPIYKLDISKQIKLNKGYNTNGELLSHIIFALQELRNTVAHNGVIFDTRFKKRNIPNVLANSLMNDTGIANISFQSIIDYLILIIYFLKNFGYTKTELRIINSQFSKAVDDFYNKIDNCIYFQVLKPDDKSKLNKLQAYIQK